MFLFVELPIEKGVKNTIDNPLLGVFKKTFLKLGARETYRIQNVLFIYSLIWFIHLY